MIYGISILTTVGHEWIRKQVLGTSDGSEGRSKGRDVDIEKRDPPQKNTEPEAHCLLLAHLRLPLLLYLCAIEVWGC